MAIPKGLRRFGQSLLGWRFWCWTILFLLSYWLLSTPLENNVAALIVLPLFYFAYTYGRWGGFVAGVLTLPFDMGAFYIIDQQLLFDTINKNFWAVHFILPLMFFEIGYGAELRKRVTRELQRSRQLAVELADERDRVQRGSEVKDALLMSISHDLRTPVSAMIQSAQLIEADPSHVQRHAQLIQRSGYQLLQVVNELLRGYRQSEEAPAIRAEAFDLRRLLTETVELHQPLFTAKDLTLTLATDDTLPDWVEGHVQQLRQILANLLSNSLKYTESGGATLAARTLAARTLAGESNRQLEFVVSDTGPGIAEERITPLMNAARERPQPHVDGEKVSFGLGLGNCLRMSDAIGATLQLLPNHPCGLRVVLRMPLLLAAAPENLYHRERIIEPVDKRLPVLVIDDDPISAETLVDMLRQLSCNVSCTTDGRSAKQMVSNAKFTLVFIDMQLPDTDGVHLIDELRRAIPDATLVLFSANILLTDLDQWLNPDIDLILSKPIELHDLSTLCRRSCRRSRRNHVGLPDNNRLTVAVVEERYREIMFGYLKEALAAFGRQDHTACARELHRLASAAGTLRVNALAELSRQVESEAISSSRIELFDSLRQLTHLCKQILATPST